MIVNRIDNRRSYLIGPVCALLIAACLPAVCVHAQDGIAESRRNAIVCAIERVAPSVCSINIVRLEAERFLDPFSDGFWDFFDFPRPWARLREHRFDSIGSGFIIDEAAHVLTNYHVIEGADRVASVTLADGRELDAEFVGADERSDLAVLRVKGDNLPHVEFGDSDGLLIGEWAIAIGNPFGPLMNDSQPTVSIGIVSANHRRVSRTIAGGERLYQDLIQTDAAINAGNSGGPLVNSKGEVIGINTMIFTQTGGSVGLGFALPINRCRRVAQEIIEFGRRRDPWPGFVVADIRSLRGDVFSRLDIRADYGCIVIEILKDCPAYRAGLRLGDVITAVNGKRVTHPTEIDLIIWSLFVGDTLTLDIDRQGVRHEIEFELVELTKR